MSLLVPLANRMEKKRLPTSYEKCACGVLRTRLTLKQLERREGAFSNVATDALVLKHQTISTHSADEIFIVLDQFDTKILRL